MLGLLGGIIIIGTGIIWNKKRKLAKQKTKSKSTEEQITKFCNDFVRQYKDYR